MSKGVSIQYGDIAVGAKENFNTVASESYYPTVENLKINNRSIKNFACPGEYFQTILDGSAEALPKNPVNDVGIWSVQLSDEVIDDGMHAFEPPYDFETPIMLTLTSDYQYSSQGFTLTFDKYNDIYPLRMSIQWLRVVNGEEEALTDEVEYSPNSGYYFCRNKIENFNKVIMKFYNLNMPSCRLKIESIDFGYGTFFGGDELRNVKISQSIDPISSEIKISTCDFTLDSKSDMNYTFQNKQPLTVYFNDKIISTSFVKKSNRKSAKIWDVNAEDYVGLLDSTIFIGGIYENKNAVELLTEIFSVAKVPYKIDSDFENATVSGHIPYTTCRQALLLVCFAIQAVVDTSYSDVVHVKKLNDDITQTFELDRIMQGQTFTNGATVTGIELTSHKYSESDEQLVLYEAEDEGPCENLMIKFSEPLHSLKGSSCEIIESGANYAIITINNTNGWFKGYKYNHVTTVHKKNNPLVLESEAENVITITDATLISSSNVDNVLDKCYNWLIRVDETSSKLVIGKEVIDGVVVDQSDIRLGDVITLKTEYNNDITGNVVSQSFNLNGNIIVKEVTVK